MQRSAKRHRQHPERGRVITLCSRIAIAGLTLAVLAVTRLASSAPAQTLLRLRGQRLAVACSAAGLAAGLVVTATALSSMAPIPPEAASAAAAAMASAGAGTRPTTGQPDAARAAAAERADRSRRSATTTAKPPAPRPPAWRPPIHNAVLTSCYGWRWGAAHKGIDFAAPFGTPILAVGTGTVVAAGWLYAGYGISVVIDHGNGYLSHYAHASAVLVRAGQRVKPGTPIAREGSTGDSTGPHLHFEIHKGMWNQVNPAPWLRTHGIRVGC